MHDDTELEAEQPPRGTAVHTVPPARRVAAWLVVLVSAMVFVACLAVPYAYPYHFEVLYAAAAGALLAGTAVLATARHAQLLALQAIVDDRGLLVRLHDGTRALRWRDMRGVRLRPLLHRLEIRDASSAAPFMIPFALDGYDEIAALAASRAQPERRPGVSGAREFRCRRVDAATPVVAPVVVALSIALYGTVLIIAWLVAGSALLYWLTTWLRIRVADDALVFVRPIGERRLAFADIAATRLGALEPRQSLRPTLLVLAATGAVIDIAGVREGEHALHEALVAALDAYHEANGGGVPAHSAPHAWPAGDEEVQP